MKRLITVFIFVAGPPLMARRPDVMAAASDRYPVVRSIKSRAEELMIISGKSFSPRYTLTLPSSISITHDFLPGISEKVKGKKAAPGVMVRVVPSTNEVYGKLLKEGHIQTLFDAGFIVSNPGCGGCASGQIGMTGEGEVQISTSNRNFKGKQGAGETYLASPETAAASAILGRIGTWKEVA